MKDRVEQTHKDTVRAVDRMIDILETFSFEKPEMTLSEIHVSADLPKTTAYRILTTLEQRNMVVLDSETGKYRLGYDIVKMGCIAQIGNSLQRASMKDMEMISAETEQTCNLYVRDGMERMCIAQVEGPQYVKRFSFLGARFPLYCGAGKLLLAYSPAEFQRQYFERMTLEKCTENTRTVPEQLESELSLIRERGYAVSLGERDALTAAVCVPVYDYSNKVVATVTVSGPIYLFTEENVARYLKTLKKGAAAISKRLGSQHTH